MLIVLCLALAVCYVLEFVRPMVARPRIASWVWRVWALNLVHVAVAVSVVVVWRRMAAGSDSLLHLSASLPCLVAGTFAYVVYTFVFYWWHRARHRFDALWRVLHQIHHSPRRLETVTAFYKHPLETVVNATLAGLLMFQVLGLDLEAATLCTVLAGLADLFYHANVRTPRWVGAVVQRPEMHRLHHEADRHEGNYGDLPVWDYLFGTLRLPADTAVACGFTAEREERLAEMLRGIDVHREERR